MDGAHNRNDSQFISFQDFPPMTHSGNSAQAQLDVGSSTHYSSNSGQAQIDIGTSSHQTFNNLPNDTTGIGIIEDLRGMPDNNEGQQQRSFWTIEYYQKFFNVNTYDVLDRIKRSMIPHGNDNYLVSHIRPNPDLYGPFWICVTLVFSIAISGNMADYLHTANSTHKYHWRYDFHMVSYAATGIFLYAWLLPLILWGVIKWTTAARNTEEELIESYAIPGLLELLCLYGYSLAIYIPVAFLWMIQIDWLQWSLVGVATLLSGGVLLHSLLPVISGKHRIIYIVAILGMHLLLAAGFMLYFFHGSKEVPPPIHVLTTVPPTAAVHVANNISKTMTTVQS